MTKLLSNTWAVVAIIVAVIASLTALAIAKIIPAADVVKVLSAFLAGAGVAWQRGALQQQLAPVAAEEEKPKPPIPPVLPLLVLCLAISTLPAATCSQAKTTARTVNDVAAEICAAYYSEQKGISTDDALKAFCTGEQVLAPWIHLVLSAEKSGVDKNGLTMCALPAKDAGAD